MGSSCCCSKIVATPKAHLCVPKLPCSCAVDPTRHHEFTPPPKVCSDRSVNAHIANVCSSRFPGRVSFHKRRCRPQFPASQVLAFPRILDLFKPALAGFFSSAKHSGTCPMSRRSPIGQEPPFTHTVARTSRRRFYPNSGPPSADYRSPRGAVETVVPRPPGVVVTVIVVT